MAPKLLTTVPMSRLLLKCSYVLVGLLLAGTIAAFLRIVSMWSLLTAALVLMGMVLTFLLGIFVGYDRISPRHRRRFSGQGQVTLARSSDQLVRSH